MCGTTEHVVAHHHDYSKPLDVTWLCEQHHKDVHNAPVVKPCHLKVGDIVTTEYDPHQIGTLYIVNGVVPASEGETDWAVYTNKHSGIDSGWFTKHDGKVPRDYKFTDNWLDDIPF